VDARAYKYILPYWRRLGLVLAISVASTGLSLYLPYLTMPLVDVALLGRDSGALMNFVMTFILVGLAGFVLSVVSGLQYTRVSAEILFDMRRDLYEHLQRLSPRFYATARLGDIVSRINNDIGEIQRVAAETALAWVGNVLFLAGSLAILLWLDWRLCLVGLATLPVSAWMLAVYRRSLERRVTVLRERSADLGSFLIETLPAMRTVVTSGAERREVERFSRLNDAFIATLMGVQRVQYLTGGVPSQLIAIGTAAAFFYGGWRVIEGTLTLGALATFLAYQARVVAPVQALMGLYGALATARVSWRRVAELLGTPPEVTDRPDATPQPTAEGAIEFDAVSVAFGRGADVLDRVSFQAPAGLTTAVVGASGSGKSTIADLAVRLLDPDAGVVRLDGRDLRSIRLDDVRRLVRAVPQEPAIFHASIDENVRYTNPAATDAEVARALSAAGLSRFVAALPEGSRTVVGERGLALSAGERQRIAVARALAASPAVLILDEPSAALDPVSEREVVQGVRDVMRGRTVIVITHRLDVVRAADHVVVLEGARVVQAGPPAALEEAGGAFRTLFLSSALAT
jgi:ATP-binding cassette subfamily B protein